MKRSNFAKINKSQNISFIQWRHLFLKTRIMYILNAQQADNLYLTIELAVLLFSLYCF